MTRAQFLLFFGLALATFVTFALVFSSTQRSALYDKRTLDHISQGKPFSGRRLPAQAAEAHVTDPPPPVVIENTSSDGGAASPLSQHTASTPILSPLHSEASAQEPTRGPSLALSAAPASSTAVKRGSASNDAASTCTVVKGLPNLVFTRIPRVAGESMLSIFRGGVAKDLVSVQAESSAVRNADRALVLQQQVQQVQSHAQSQQLQQQASHHHQVDLDTQHELCRLWTAGGAHIFFTHVSLIDCLAVMQRQPRFVGVIRHPVDQWVSSQYALHHCVCETHDRWYASFTHGSIYIYIYMCVCVCVCGWVGICVGCGCAVWGVE
jgi:hypothetical protein